MTIRKNFLFDEDTAQHLKDIALREKTTQTQVVKDLIENKYDEISVEKKLEAFDKLIYSVEKSGKNIFLEQFEKDDQKILQKVKGMME